MSVHATEKPRRITSGRDRSSPVQSFPSLWERETLLGDWGGLRPALGEKGITWDTSLTSFYTGSLQGGQSDRDFEFSQRFDALIAADTEKMGLWENGGFRFHLEAIYGEADTFRLTSLSLIA